ncbi:MAG: ATP-binding cassette domain-containing protein [Bacteroidales bacterium]|jgi:ABC-type multidrug transport system ATPase subunit|nr:ATP-binding cassette domain-containing protein [Bacteroidales bacterium]
MSERILKALMQLFAIISRPESDKSERRKVVAGFLRKQLNQQLAQEYIRVFDNYYVQYQEKYKDEKKHQKHTSSSSVKLLVICVQINNELTQRQKFTLIVLLLSFIKSGHEEHSTISEFEQDFVETVAQAFYFEHDEFQETLQFVMLPIDFIPESSNLLLINNGQKTDRQCKRLYREGIGDSLAVLHARSVNMYICRYEGARNLYLNSQAMSMDNVYVLHYGCSIRNPQTKPVYYSDIVNCFYLETQSAPMLFEAQNVEYEFENGNIGLHAVNFEIFSGNIVGIMGGSGAGKSTLLSVLTGLYQPTKGKVLLNNTDIHTQSQATEGLIGYVSQDDLLVEELTVFQNLYFNAKLCFGQFTDEEIRQKTGEVLHDLGLYEIRNMRVGSPLNKKISGGQRKRLNIALEMIRQPAVLFLDEPTSGLSSRDSDNIMDLLKELSLKGKLVFVVIHQPSSDIFKMFDRLLVLDQGGYLIYNGNPVDSILYFKSQTNQANRDTSECPECRNVNPEQIFNIVEARVLDEQGQTTGTRRISPAEWYDAFAEMPKTIIPEAERPEKLPPSGAIKRPSRLKQFMVYAARNILTKVSDLQYMVVCLFEAPLLALLLSYIIRYYNVSEGGYTFELNENVPIYIFVAVIIAIFIGLSVSAEEIIKDRKIIKRESFLNLSRSSYLFSKILVLFAISAIQAILFILVGNSVTGILHQTFAYWVVLFSAWTCANLIGLIISDAFKSVVTIYILIPFIVIPQLMLSGVLLRFEKINPDISNPASVPWYGEMITARWAFEALAVEQFMNNDYERIMYPYEKSMSIAEFQKNYWLVEMKNKLNRLKIDIAKEGQPAPELLSLLDNEIERENKRQDVVRFSFRKELSAGLSQKLIDETSSYFDQLTRYYSTLYNKSAERRDRLMSEIATVNPDSLLTLKSRYYNQSLSNMVKSSNETYRLIEYKGRLLQNYHQVYTDPENKFIKAQFYAPVKQFFGRYYPTMWINVFAIWCFNILFFVALYFRWLPNLLNIFQKRKH